MKAGFNVKPDDTLISTGKAAKRLATSTQTIRKLVKAGKLKAIKLKKQLRVYEGSVNELIEKSKV